MVVSTNTVIKISLLGFMGIMLVLIIWPYTPEIPKIDPGEMDGTLEEVNVSDIASDLDVKSSDYPAVLFGWVRPTSVPTPPPTPAPAASPEPTRPVAGWLMATNGTRKDEKGITWYLFRDNSSTSTVYWLCYEEFTRGWKIFQEQKDFFILVDRSNAYWTVYKEK